MTHWIIRPDHLIEPAIAPEFFIDGIGAIELISGCLRIYLFATQMPLEAMAGEAQNIVMAKVVAPLTAVPGAIGQLAMCLMPVTQSADGGHRREKPHLVT